MADGWEVVTLALGNVCSNPGEVGKRLILVFFFKSWMKCARRTSFDARAQHGIFFFEEV